MSVSHVKSLSILGLDGIEIDVEVDLGLGLPNFSVVGLPDKAVEEAKERVKSALKNSHLPFPQHRVTINLAPADIKKFGTWYDLPIAIGIAACMEQISADSLKDCAVIGELSLSGDVRPVAGVFPAALYAASCGWKSLFVPAGNAKEAALVEGIDVYPVESLKDMLFHLRNEKKIVRQDHVQYSPEISSEFSIDLDQIKGQLQAKRALEIAAAGGHNILMVGPPGSGKTLLAKAFSGILPTMGKEEVFEVTKIYSVAGLLSSSIPLITYRPFRSPHHTASLISLVGGGQWPKPGEISLAHRGVLFMDELPEFPRSLLESLRQPMEDGRVIISRAAGSISFPAKFILLATQNPCPCGYLYDSVKHCRCSASEISHYQRKLSGPLLDRIDIHIAVPRVAVDDLSEAAKVGEPTQVVRDRVEEARKIQNRRYEKTNIICNAEMNLKMISEYCHLDQTGSAMIKQATERLGLSARSYHKILKIARTIADISGCEDIKQEYIAEALQFRDPNHSSM